MSHHVAGAVGSKWGNPFKVKKHEKNSRNKCLKRYEDYVRNDPVLFNAVIELGGKELGCWCKPFPCHGDILIKLFKERQGANLSPRFSNFDSVRADPTSSSINDSYLECQTRISCEVSGGNCTVGAKCTSRDQVITEDMREDIAPQCQANCLFEDNTTVCTPLRLTGGGNTSFECQDNMNSDCEGNSLFEDSFTNSNGSQEALSFINEDNSMSEQDIRDVLFNAGYSPKTINP